MKKLNNYKKGVVHSKYLPKKPPLTEYNGTLKHYNETSLNNFLRYGKYRDKLEDRYDLNKSIADILLLNDAECHVLYNFIEICRLNVELITGMKKKDSLNDLFFKLLVSIDNPPTELPMFYKYAPLREDLFYYKLILSLHKWMIIYQSFCNENGVRKIMSNEVIDMNLFNGKLNKIEAKIRTYLVKSKIIFDSLDIELEEEIELPLERSDGKMDKNSIKEALKLAIEEMGEEANERHHEKSECFAPHKKHHYDFEESGFNVPTLIKPNTMVYCDEQLEKLIPRMGDGDRLFIPKESIVNGIYTFDHMRDVKIVGLNTKINACFKFNDFSGSVENLVFNPYIKEYYDEKESCEGFICEGKTRIRIEDCAFNGFEKECILCPNSDSYSEVELYLCDVIFNSISDLPFIKADSINKLECLDCDFLNNPSPDGAVYIYHTNNSKSVVKFDDCNFINLDTAIRLVNNKISQRVGIVKAYILNCKFINNLTDLVIGEGNSELTNVDYVEKFNAGLEKIELLYKPSVSDEEDNDETEDEEEIDPDFSIGNVYHL